jgi:hypothetical protein
MLDQDSHKSFYRSKNSAMHHNGATESRLEWMLNPGPVLVGHIVSLENLFLVVFLGDFCLVFCSMLLFLGCGLRLILQVKSDRKLEIKLNGTALVGTFQSIKHLDVNFGTVESTITNIEFPGTTKSIKGFLKGSFSFVPKVIITKTDFGAGGKF